MSLLSLQFLGFVCVVLTLYYTFPRYQTRILLVANLTFLATWSWTSLGLLLILSQLTYFTLKAAHFRPGAKLTLLLTLLPGSVLIYYKIQQAQTPVQVDEMTNLIIPLGLSYYVFQLSGYVIDCYRGEVTSPYPWRRFTTFSSFFPQLMIGPIERYNTMRDQFVDGTTFDYDRFIHGLFRIALGVLKKLTLADPLFPVFRLAFQHPESLSPWQVLLFCFVGFFQIYFDFSSYADMAVGLGRLFGIRLTENFRQPYLATSVSDIWQRWHYSLVRWVRSYVFLPLYLKTRSILLCTLITFVIVGMWHQLNLNLLFWALYWFTLFYFETLIKKTWPGSRVPLWLCRLGSLIAMSLASVFFIDGGPLALRFQQNPAAGSAFNTRVFGLTSLDLIGIGLCFTFAILQEFVEFNERFARLRRTSYLIGFTLVAVFLATLFAKDLPRPFIYLMF